MGNLTKITLEWLREHDACEDWVEWFKQRPHLHGAEWPTVCKALEANGHYRWSELVRIEVAAYGSDDDRRVLRNDPRPWVRWVVARCGSAADHKAMRNDRSMWVRVAVAVSERAAREKTT